MNKIIDKVQKDKLLEIKEQLEKMEKELHGISHSLITQINEKNPRRVTEYTPILFRLANTTETLLSIIKENIECLRNFL